MSNKYFLDISYKIKKMQYFVSSEREFFIETTMKIEKKS
jgi:hypothetical protein